MSKAPSSTPRDEQEIVLSGKSTEERGKDSEKEQEQKNLVDFKDLFQYAEGIDLVLVALGSIFAIAAGVAMPYFIVLFGEMIDKLNLGELSLVEAVNELVVIFVIMSVLMFFASCAYCFCWALAGDRQAMKIRKVYMGAVLRQDIPWFDENKPSELPTTITDATTKLQEGLGRKVGDILQFSTQFVGGFVIALIWSWKLTLVLLAALPIIILSMAYLMKVIGNSSHQESAQYSKAGSVAIEVLSSIRTVVSLTGEKKEVTRYSEYLKEAEKIGISKALHTGIGNGLVLGMIFMSYALGFWYGAELVAEDIDKNCTDACTTGGDIITCFFCVITGAMALGQTSPGFSAIANARAAAVMVFETIAREPPIDASSSTGDTLSVVKGTIDVCNVSFAYPTRPNNMVYRDFNLKIHAGETLALVGGSGEGKSTLLSLLLRYYDPLEGQIFLDGKPVTSLNLRWLRDQIGYVGQEPVLFAGTIRENIQCGKQDANTTEIKEAAISANAHNFIMSFEQDYFTDTGEAGAKISGGQKQRIAIARALVKKPKILLLDEATSALDNESERVVQTALDSLQSSNNFTTIVIAHRLSTIKNVDRIAVVSGGRIKEIGSHEDLIWIEGGAYAELVEHNQTQEPQNKEGGTRSRTTSKSYQAADEDFRKREASLSGSVGSVFTGGAQQLADIVDPITSKITKHLEQVVEAKEEDEDKDEDLVSVAPTAVMDAKVAHSDGEDIETGNSPATKVGMGRILSYSKADWKYLVIGLFGSCVSGMVFPVWGLLLAQVQDMFYADSAEDLRNEAVIWSLSFAALGLVFIFASVFQFAGLGTVGERLTRHLRTLAFESMIRHEIGWFDRDDKMTGTLVEQLSDDATMVHKVAAGQLGKMLQNLFSLFVGLGISFWASWQMALAVLAVFPLFVIASAVNARFAVKGITDDEEEKGEGDQAGATLSAAITGIRTVASFNMETTIQQVYEKALDVGHKKRNKINLMAGLTFGFSQCMMFLMYAFLFWLGAKLIAEGQITFVDLMTAMFAIVLAAIGLGNTAADSTDQGEAAGAAARIFQLVDEAESLPENLDVYSDSGQRLKDMQGTIEFKSVAFAYPTRPHQRILSDFNLKVKSGTTVALVGPSGNGKSTIMSLLLRFYSPQSGSILIDEFDSMLLNTAWLRQQIGYVGQEPVLFSGTIRSNITYGKDDATEQEIVAAAKAANAHDFIQSFEHGYDTDTGERSILLSGGQKQRVAIARAIIRDPKILLLDEATSALDTNSERDVQKALDDLQKQKKMTTLVIAHRLSTIENADNIAVIKSGRVAEIGTHKQLMKRHNGIYASLQNA